MHIIATTVFTMKKQLYHHHVAHTTSALSFDGSADQSELTICRVAWFLVTSAPSSYSEIPTQLDTRSGRFTDKLWHARARVYTCRPSLYTVLIKPRAFLREPPVWRMLIRLPWQFFPRRLVSASFEDSVPSFVKVPKTLMLDLYWHWGKAGKMSIKMYPAHVKSQLHKGTLRFPLRISFQIGLNSLVTPIHVTSYRHDKFKMSSPLIVQCKRTLCWLV